MLSYRLGTVNDFHWGFKPVLSYSKPHTFSTLLYSHPLYKSITLNCIACFDHFVLLVCDHFNYNIIKYYAFDIIYLTFL